MDSLTFVGGIFVGAFIGSLLWELLVAGPSYRKLQRHQNRLYDRLLTWQRVAVDAIEERDATDLDKYGDNTTHSLKVLS